MNCHKRSYTFTGLGFRNVSND